MKEIKNLLDLFLSDFSNKNNNFILFKEWNKIMFKFKEITSIKKIENKILYVEVFDERYLYELNLISSNIINVLNENIKNLFLEKIKFFKSRNLKKNKESSLKIKKNLEFKDCTKDEFEIFNAKNYIHKCFNFDDSMSNNLINIYKKFVYK